MNPSRGLALGLLLVSLVCAPAQARLYRLSNRSGFSIVLTDIGAALQSVLVPSCTGSGRPIDVLLGYQNEADYPKNPHSSFGATVGRVANRVAGAAFQLDGRTIKLAANDGPNTIHGGAVPWSKQTWSASPEPGGRAVVFSRASPDGESGFPGAVAARVRYSIPESGAAINISMTANVSGQATPLNIINHSYWNLKGAGNGLILDHIVQLPSQYYTPADATLLPTGQVFAVAGSPYDFSSPTAIQKNYLRANGGLHRGFDTNYVMPGGESSGRAQPVWWLSRVNPQVVRVGASSPRPLVRMATVTAPGKGGLRMRAFADTPGVQFYSGNYLNGNATMAGPGKGGVYYPQYAGFCLEAQAFPNAINTPEFPSSVVRPGQAWASNVAFEFDCPSVDRRL